MVGDKDTELFMITDAGVVIRIPVSQISIFGRNAQGVKVMNLNDSKIMAVAKPTVVDQVDSEIVSGEEK